MIKIHINRRLVDAPRTPMTALEILDVGGFGADYELYELHGEGDPSGGTLIPHDQEVGLANGMHFRALPGNANFGTQD